ncbi:MAG TPA: hypothetical protein VFT87_04495 [Candidatus Saccharimonadales bacterium]|nr:hypothetical protein [Candidatus Saccharimonadales bacterium]
MTKQNPTHTPSIKHLVLIGSLFGLSLCAIWWLSQRLAFPILFEIVAGGFLGAASPYSVEILTLLIAAVVWSQLFKKMNVQQPWQVAIVLTALSIGTATLALNVLNPSLGWQFVWRAIFYALAGLALTPWILGWSERLKQDKQAKNFIAAGSIIVAIGLLVAADLIRMNHKLLFGY